MSMILPLTIKQGSTGPSVVAWQKLLGITADGSFGPKTLEATIAWQAEHGLVSDGVVGPKSWAAALAADGVPGIAPLPPADPRAPACMAALRDANARWPNRRRQSDGIMGDASHQLTHSDHNDGNAVDITHDPSGADGHAIAADALKDARTKYVIWNKQIWNKERGDEAWRPYTGANPHTHHVHISVRTALRGDNASWPWAT